MHDRDCLHRFMFERYPIRGHLVHLDAAWRALIEHRDYPGSIREVLGEAVAASLLLAATIKFEGVLSLQMRGDGPVHLILAQCTGGLGVRGLARYRETDASGAAAGAEAGAGAEADAIGSGMARIADLIGAGNLTVTLETDGGAQRYQGIVPIVGQRLAESLQVYFENSEQLPTRLWLHADSQGASGMLLQKLPEADPPQGAAAADPAAVEDAWRRVQLIGETLTALEMRTLRDAEILRRLFNEDDVRLFEPAPVFFRCRCSRERVGSMLQSLAVDIAQLFNPQVVSDRGSSVH
jgi:molecular chaperone Hsp33